MKSAGELLKTARQRENISLNGVAEATKIKKEFLEAIEESDFQKISSPASISGFIKNYAEFLGLSSKRVLGAFRRDAKLKEKKEIIPRSIMEKWRQSGVNWNPKATLILITLAVLCLLSVYLGFQYFSLKSSPELKLFQPQEGQQVREKKLTVVGKSDPDATVTVNGHLVSLSPKGEFRFYLDLLPGKNKIVVEAANKVGKKSRIERTVLTVEDKEK